MDCLLLGFSPNPFSSPRLHGHPVADGWLKPLHANKYDIHIINLFLCRSRCSRLWCFLWLPHCDQISLINERKQKNASKLVRPAICLRGESAFAEHSKLSQHSCLSSHRCSIVSSLSQSAVVYVYTFHRGKRQDEKMGRTKTFDWHHPNN